MRDTVYDPISTRISFEADKEACTAKCEAAGIATVRGDPIRNPVTGAEHRAGIYLPNGFEYTLSECGRGWSASEGMVALNLEDSYAHWVIIDMNQHGVIR